MESRGPQIDGERIARLERLAQRLRSDVLRVLTAIGHPHRGHPGSCLSIADIVTALYFDVLRIDPAAPGWPDRDRLVLSKGHGCLAVYAALAERGFFDRSHLLSFRSVDSMLQGHPDMRRTPGIDMTSGSLGNGLSAAVGLALAVRRDGKDSNVFVIAGDGELQEGVIWEGAMAAARYELDNLIVFVDRNGLQASGPVSDIMPIEPLAAKWQSFGWNVADIDGHDMRQILSAVAGAQSRRGRPSVILARTVKGKGVSYMEGDNAWHQRSPEVARSTKVSRADAGLVSTRVAYGNTLVALARAGCDIVVVSADSASSMGLDDFVREFPNRYVEVGVAEQTMMLVAAGLAAAGKTVFASTYSVFASMRACEQVRTFIAYPGLNVKIAGGLGGLSGGIEGVTHLAVEDLGILRCIPGLVVLNPADAIATGKAVRAAAAHPGPVFIRLGRDPTPVLFDDSYAFEIGKAVVLLHAGWDIALLTTGLITAEVLRAARSLVGAGLGCTVVEFPTVKPIDRETLLDVARRATTLVTIEEHTIAGGFGGAVAECVAEMMPVAVHRIGLPDCFLESGTAEELRRKYGLTADGLVARVRALHGSGTRVLGDEERTHPDVQGAQHEHRGGEHGGEGKRHESEAGKHDDEHRSGGG